jgi:hypothetical protein
MAGESKRPSGKQAPALPASLLQTHRNFNRNSADLWDAFTTHREQVMALALAQAGTAAPSRRLAVLGAGNANDLDLPRLVAAFAEVHLVDLDSEALARARARQPAEVAAALRLHAPVDVTGVLPRMPGLRPTDPPAVVERLVEQGLAAAEAALPGPFDVVLSTGLLGQLMHTCRLTLSADHPHLKPLAAALGVAHLQLLGRLTRLGGTALLVTDTVSSETYPLEELWDRQPPRALLAQLEASDNVFTGTGAAYLRRLLAREPLASLFAPGGVRLVDPWLWRLGNKVTLLAYAYTLARKA